MRLAQTIEALTETVRGWHAEGRRIGLVPTMGWFHPGHLSLMRMARSKAEKVVVTLFVNPIQFGRGEDLSTYPHDLDRDMRLAEAEGVDLLFAPEAAHMYPPGFQTGVTVKTLTQGLCGASRPGHFDGVATVVAKLFNLVQPHMAVFGEKDYQQLAVIRRMVRDLNYAIEIVGHPIVRESDGLAMSSRNSYLDAEERRNALCLHQSLIHAKKRAAEVGAGLSASLLVGEIEQIITATAGCTIDYVAVVDKDTLLPCEHVGANSLLALAVKINNRVRLIDNALLASNS